MSRSTLAHLLTAEERVALAQRRRARWESFVLLITRLRQLTPWRRPNLAPAKRAPAWKRLPEIAAFKDEPHLTTLNRKERVAQIWPPPPRGVCLTDARPRVPRALTSWGEVSATRPGVMFTVLQEVQTAKEAQQ